MNNILYILLFVCSIMIAAYSQILLKKGAGKKNIYLNRYTIIGYAIMIISTLFTLIAYKKINLSLGQVLQSLSFIFVLLLSHFILKENINKKQIIGIAVIIVGIIVFNI